MTRSQQADAVPSCRSTQLDSVSQNLVRSRASEEDANVNVQLTAATTRYDHTRDLVTGDVRVEGADVIWLQLGAEEVIPRFVTHREWDVSEISMALYTA